MLAGRLLKDNLARHQQALELLRDDPAVLELEVADLVRRS